jgi:aminopeptidase-like protein
MCFIYSKIPEMDTPTGQRVYSFLKKIWPYCRSITGEGLRKTLQAIQNEIPELSILEIPSGSQALDWIVPDEWTIREAWVKNPSGQKVIDFADNNLHILGYSDAFYGWVSKEDLLAHLYTLETQPDVIPYVTSYYKRRWGFCLAHEDLALLNENSYEVYIDADLKPGSLSIGELFLPGDSREEILFSTYSCHPSLANDQLSGVGLAMYLAKWLNELPARKYTYRFLFLPEIIGSAAYLHRYKNEIQTYNLAAFNITCVGDERCWSFLPSRKGNSLSDKAVLNLLGFYTDHFIAYSWNDRGSDESMFCAPGIDIPMVSMMRSKYGTFPEYHTSADTLSNTVSAEGLEQSFQMYVKLIQALEYNYYPKTAVAGEPQLGRRGLYPDLSMKGSTNSVKNLLNILSYCDGEHDIFDISNKAKVPVLDVIGYLELFKKNKLIQFFE